MLLNYRRWRYKLFFNILPKFVLGLACIYVYCEYLIYYVTQIQCGWPALTNSPSEGADPLYAMIIADTHLLGSRNGHWMDKWRREWQMHRAFQTAMTLHRPDAVFVLGDLFDEGKWCSEKEFKDYVERFYKMFKVPEGTTMYAVVGNHDIGFHYSITPHLAKRFESKFDAPPVRLVTIKGNHFVLINSMAMEGDGCTLCQRAVTEIDNIADILKCSSGSTLCKGNTKLEKYSRPIIMQHYPLYRESDSICTEADAAPLPERNSLFEERWDCLSKESTEYLVESLRPRAAFGAHTHHGCVVRHSFVPTPDHKTEFIEYTVPSFSWRNRLDPKYYLVQDFQGLSYKNHIIGKETKKKLLGMDNVFVGYARSDQRLSKESPLQAHDQHGGGARVQVRRAARAHHAGDGRAHDARTAALLAVHRRRGHSVQQQAPLTISTEEVRVSKCGVPRERTMQATAALMTLALLLCLRFTGGEDTLFNNKHLTGKKV